MTTSEIRTAYRNGDSHWEILARLVTQGMDFSDAQFRVTEALRLDPQQVAEMVDAYDNHC